MGYFVPNSEKGENRCKCPLEGEQKNEADIGFVKICVPSLPQNTERGEKQISIALDQSFSKWMMIPRITRIIHGGGYSL